jgi:hypothetical protein
MLRTNPAATLVAALSFAAAAAAQNCYDNPTQCFSFAPHPDDVGRVDTGLGLRSKQLTITGDFRIRVRGAETADGNPYNTNHQQASRARLQLAYKVNEKVDAFAEFNFSETWAGSEPYSDALPDENFNKLTQAWVAVNDMFGVGDKWRVGRSHYVLANGLILGSCDFLQVPASFTGVWVSKNFCDRLDVEGFLLDDYGPLQAQVDGTRYGGGTARVKVDDECPLHWVSAYLLVGTRDGDTVSEDMWYGAEGGGDVCKRVGWNAEFAHRQVDGAKDRNAYRFSFHKKFDSWLEEIRFTRTDAEGAMHVNPSDFNSAGLLHQFAGAWRSDLDTNQLGFQFAPGGKFDLGLNVLTLDRDGTATQEGELEVDITVGKTLDSGVHLFAGYGRDDEDREVGYFQMSVYF